MLRLPGRVGSGTVLASPTVRACGGVVHDTIGSFPGVVRKRATRFRWSRWVTFLRPGCPLPVDARVAGDGALGVREELPPSTTSPPER